MIIILIDLFMLQDLSLDLPPPSSLFLFHYPVMCLIDLLAPPLPNCSIKEDAVEKDLWSEDILKSVVRHVGQVGQGGFVLQLVVYCIIEYF
jgi:hypothetical protein